MAKTQGGERTGRQTFYFDKKRRSDMRTASAKAGQTANQTEPQRAEDDRNVG